MEGDPGGFQIDDLGPQRESGPDRATASYPRRFHFPILTFAALFGLLAAAAAVLNADVLNAEANPAASDASNWKLSALLIAAIASAWFAGISYLATAWFRPAGGRARLHTSVTAWLTAFSAGPFLVALLLLAISLAQNLNARAAVIAASGAVLLGLIFGQQRYRLLAERMLVSFFLWIAILIVPTFWRDAVNLQMSEFLFGLLNAAGLP